MGTNKEKNSHPNDKQPSQPDSGPLSYLPDDLRHLELYPRSPLSVFGLLAQTSTLYEADTALLRLLPSALNSEPVSYKPESYADIHETSLAAMKILERHRDLVFVTSLIEDHVGRKINGSTYRIFLGTGDAWAISQVHELILPHIKNGELLAKAQFQTQFPNCPWPFDPTMPEEVLYDDRNKAQIAQVKAQLKIIVEKISADPCTDGRAMCKETFKAVAELCEIFKPKAGEIITTGLHFPLGIMDEIAKIYDAQFAHLRWTDAQLSYFLRAVMGPAIGALSALDGQCVKIGLANLNMKTGPDRRDGVSCPRPKGIPDALIPLTGKLGRTCFIDPYDGEVCSLSSKLGYFDWYNKFGQSEVQGVRRRRAGGKRWESLWRAKAEVYGSYYSAKQTEIKTSSRCP